MIFANIQSNSDWLFSAQLRVLPPDWLILENNEKATLNINMPYYSTILSFADSKLLSYSCLVLQVIEHSPNGTFVAHVRVEDQDSGSNGLVTCVISSPYFLLQNSYEVR